MAPVCQKRLQRDCPWEANQVWASEQWTLYIYDDSQWINGGINLRNSFSFSNLLTQFLHTLGCQGYFISIKYLELQ